MQTNCVEMPLDSVHVPLPLLGASLRCIVHTILMMRLPHDSSSSKATRTSMESQQLGARKAPQQAHPLSSNGKLQRHEKTLPAAPAAAAPIWLQGGADYRKGGDLTTALSSLRSSPSTDRSTSSSSCSSSTNHISRFELQQWDYPHSSSFLEGSGAQEKLLQRGRPEAHESQPSAGDLPKSQLSQNSSSNSKSNSKSSSSCCSSISSSSGGGRGGCIYVSGFAEGRDRSDLRLQPHAASPLSLIYLRLGDAPQLAEEVEKKLRAFIGFVESGASLQRQQPQAEYTMAVVLYIQRPKAFGFLSSSVERVSFERWLLPVSICWCTHECSSCCGSTRLRRQSSSCCCSTTQCCHGRHVRGKPSCLSAAAVAKGGAAVKAPHLQPQQQQQQQQRQQQRFTDYLPRGVKQQQEVEKGVRRVLFAVVEIATARQFHLPPPSVSHDLYGYDIVLSSNQAPLLGDWALQLPHAVRLL